VDDFVLKGSFVRLLVIHNVSPQGPSALAACLTWLRCPGPGDKAEDDVRWPPVGQLPR
jgi:hypothetical protein